MFVVVVVVALVCSQEIGVSGSISVVVVEISTSYCFFAVESCSIVVVSSFLL